MQKDTGTLNLGVKLFSISDVYMGSMGFCIGVKCLLNLLYKKNYTQHFSTYFCPSGSPDTTVDMQASPLQGGVI